MPVSDEALVDQADAVLNRQHARADNLAGRAAALTGFMSVAATLVLGSRLSSGRGLLVGSYLFAAVLGGIVILGRHLDQRPDMRFIKDLADLHPTWRLPGLVLEKLKCVEENRRRLRVVEWLWLAHGTAVIAAALMTALYLARSL